MKLVTLLFSIIIFLSSCGSKEQTLGEAPAKSETLSSLSDVLATPDKYHEKSITLQGVVSAQCGNRCEFTFTEGTNSAKIYMGEIKAPIIQTGTPVLVTADVFKGEKKVVLTARGFTLNAKGGK